METTQNSGCNATKTEDKKQMSDLEKAYEIDIMLNGYLLPGVIDIGHGRAFLYITRRCINEGPWVVEYQSTWYSNTPPETIMFTRSTSLEDAMWLMHDKLAAAGALEERYNLPREEFIKKIMEQ